MTVSQTKPCPECGTRHAVRRGDCAPLEQRRGPAVTDPSHPSNSGAWVRCLGNLRTPAEGPPTP